MYLVHICLLISHGNCFCAPLKWTFRTHDSQWCKHLQTRCRSHSVHSLILCCFASFPYVSSEVLIIFYQKQLWHWLCDSVKCVKYTWDISPILIEPVLVTMFGLYLISWVLLDFIWSLHLLRILSLISSRWIRSMFAFVDRLANAW